MEAEGGARGCGTPTEADGSHTNPSRRSGWTRPPSGTANTWNRGQTATLREHPQQARRLAASRQRARGKEGAVVPRRATTGSQSGQCGSTVCGDRDCRSPDRTSSGADPGAFARARFPWPASRARRRCRTHGSIDGMLTGQMPAMLRSEPGISRVGKAVSLAGVT